MKKKSSSAQSTTFLRERQTCSHLYSQLNVNVRYQSCNNRGQPFSVNDKSAKECEENSCFVRSKFRSSLAFPNGRISQLPLRFTDDLIIFIVIVL